MDKWYRFSTMKRLGANDLDCHSMSGDQLTMEMTHSSHTILYYNTLCYCIFSSSVHTHSTIQRSIILNTIIGIAPSERVF